jgi:hypothetical protein
MGATCLTLNIAALRVVCDRSNARQSDSYDEIVRKRCAPWSGALGEVEATGRLPGEHHFYITFKTGATGVDIPATFRALPRR